MDSVRIEDAIGNTPVVRVLKLVPRNAAEVWVKLEGKNPGGSVKDRAALFMIRDAEERGRIRPGRGDLLIEPTSGNTGIALAMLAASRGYRLVLTMPASMSEERRRILKAYGAELVLTDPAGRMKEALRVAREIAEREGGLILNQFENPANPEAHYRTTGPELFEALEGRLDAFVYGYGTGGTLSGVARYLKERLPRLRVYAVEPARLPVLAPGTPEGDHGFMGMGPGFVPKNLDTHLLDGAIAVREEEAFPLGLRLAREEGLFLGLSAMANLTAALKLAQELGPGRRVATIAPDGGEKYLSVSPYAD